MKNKLLAILCILTLGSCGTNPEEARLKLGQLNIPFTEKAFFENIDKGDKLVVGLFLIAGMDANSYNTSTF